MARKTAAFYEICFPGAENVRVLCAACSERACIKFPGVAQWRSDNGRRCDTCGAVKHA